jgi:DNA replication and repair protein RecF
LQIKRLTFENFRNLKKGELSLSDGVNILYGDNAQGKTNLLEGCWLFTGGKSFRGVKDKELITFGKDKATLSMSFFAGERDQEATIQLGDRRTLTLNGVSGKAPSSLVGKFCAVVFCPSHLSLLSGPKEERRKFMDAAYCQLRPLYVKVLTQFNRTLSQRNALIKSVKNGDLPVDKAKEMLLIWDSQLAEVSAKVTLARTAYIRKIGKEANLIYDGLSAGKERFSLSLLSQVGDPDGKTEAQLFEIYLNLIQRNHDRDFGAGFSTVGAHREDFSALINGVPVKNFASQGQQRSAVLSLKLAEASLLKEVTGEQPVALLDDVMSELDVSRQDYILNHIHDWQVLITCCDPATIERQTGGQVFHIQNGEIK